MPQVINGIRVYTPEELGIKPPKGGFKQGGWYKGRQYWGGTLSEPGVIHPLSDQIGAGKPVSKEVVQQTAPENWEWLQEQRRKEKLPPLPEKTPEQWTSVQPRPFLQPSQPPAGSTPTFTPPQRPKIDLMDLYEKFFNTEEIKSLEDQIEQRKRAFNKALSEINDNPFYSEATRVGKIKKLQEQFNQDISLLKDQLAKKKADAQVKLNLALKQYDIDSQEYKDTLNLLNNLLDNGALINASGSEIANFAVALGVPTSFIESIVSLQREELERKREVQPKIITVEDDNGEVRVIAIDSKTGSIINKTSLGRIGKTKTRSSSSSSGGFTTTQYRNILSKAAKILKEVDESFQTINGKLVPVDIPNPDYRLSAQEVVEAARRLAADAGIDIMTAGQFVNEAMSNLGYRKWGF